MVLKTCEKILSDIFTFTIFINSSNRICAYRITQEYEAEEVGKLNIRPVIISNCQTPGNEIFQGEGAYRFSYDSVADEVDGNPVDDWLECIISSVDTRYDLVLNKMKAKMLKLKK